MKNKNKKRVIIFYILTLPFIVLASIGFIKFCNGNKYENPILGLERSYGIELTDEMEILYNINDIGWFGEGTKYTVFKFNNNATDFFAQFIPKEPIDESDQYRTPFSDQKSLEFEEELEHIVNISEIEIQEEYKFNFEQNYS